MVVYSKWSFKRSGRLNKFDSIWKKTQIHMCMLVVHFYHNNMDVFRYFVFA